MFTYRKNNKLVHCTHNKKSQDLVKNFEEGHKPLNGYYVQNFERVVQVM